MCDSIFLSRCHVMSRGHQRGGIADKVCTSGVARCRACPVGSIVSGNLWGSWRTGEMSKFRHGHESCDALRSPTLRRPKDVPSCMDHRLKTPLYTCHRSVHPPAPRSDPCSSSAPCLPPPPRTHPTHTHARLASFPPRLPTSSSRCIIAQQHTHPFATD